MDTLIVILMGVSGTGKTTVGQLLAKDLGWQFYEGDDFHPQTNVEKMRCGVPLNDEDRFPWLQALRKLIHELISQSRPAIIVCSALKESYRSLLIDDRPCVSLVFLRGSYSLIHKRILLREHFIHPNLLGSQFSALEEPHGVSSVDIEQPPEKILEQIKQILSIKRM